MTLFDVEYIKKRFPKASELYKKEVGKRGWKHLDKWIESKGQDSRYYSIGLSKIEKTLWGE